MARGHPAGRTMGGSQGCRDHSDPPLYIYLHRNTKYSQFPSSSLPPPSCCKSSSSNPLFHMDKLQWFSIHSIFESLRSHVDYPRFIHGWMIASRIRLTFIATIFEIAVFRRNTGEKFDSLSFQPNNDLSSMKNRQFHIGLLYGKTADDALRRMLE